MIRSLWLIALALAACSQGVDDVDVSPAEPQGLELAPIVIAHRGASGEYPEHTLPAFKRAIEMGADFIEPDLVMTKDGILIVRHDRYLSTTTNVADVPEFADRKRTQVTLSGSRDDWWAEDFTLDEIKTLRARQPFSGRSKEFDDQYEIPTFAEVLALAVDAAASGQPVGVYPETKAPGHHQDIGLPMADELLADMAAARVEEWGLPIFIQSFEAPILFELASKTDLPLVQLIAGNQVAQRAGIEPSLEEIDVEGVGANKAMLFDDDGSPSDFMKRAKARGLLVHVWTVRDDQIPSRYDTVEDEIEALIVQDVDGLFTDFPDTALAVRSAVAGE